MPDFDLSVTICSWNTVALLEECLRSLAAVREEASFEVIVVDNGSTDGSAQAVRERHSWVRLLAQDKNLGFTGGHNLAIRERKGRHAFLLNSDATVHPGALKTLLEFSCQNPDIGIIGPRILNPDGSLQMSCRKFPIPAAALFRNTFLGKLFPNSRYVREYLMKDWNHDAVRDVDWVSGAAMFVSSEAIEKVGLMDEAFFMYCEDVDWCFRAHKAGFRVVYLPTAVVTHAIGKSTDQAANRMILRFHRSMLYFYKKNLLPERPAWARPALWVFAFGALSVRASIFIVKNRIDKVRRRFA